MFFRISIFSANFASLSWISISFSQEIYFRYFFPFFFLPLVSLFSFDVLSFVTSSTTSFCLLLCSGVHCSMLRWLMSQSRCSASSLIMCTVGFWLWILADIAPIQADSLSFPQSFHASACVGPLLVHDPFLRFFPSLPILPPFLSLPFLSSLSSFPTFPFLRLHLLLFFLPFPFQFYHRILQPFGTETHTDSTINHTTRLAAFIQGLYFTCYAVMTLYVA